MTQVLDQRDIDVAPASSDASFRRYFRVQSADRSFIVMDAPPAKEDPGPYIHAAKRLLEIGLNVPQILACDLERGFLLLTDLGTELYLSHLGPRTVDRLYADALGSLVVLQAGTHTDPNGFPAYNERLLNGEMELFRDWYVARHLKCELSPAQHDLLNRTFASLVRCALSQPQVWVHRDYHSRNLMVTQDNNPGILDFQDAVVGPVTYDLVSLLRDCYIAWPAEQVVDWVKGYHHLALQSGIPVADNDDLFLEWFDRMGVQRHLKVLGIFARLNYRDGKPDYLHDLPQVHRYLMEVCSNYQDLRPLQSLLSELPPEGR